MTFNKKNFRKVITQIYNEEMGRSKPVTCYFRKTLTSISCRNGFDITTTILAELETMDGKLIYVAANRIKFIN